MTGLFAVSCVGMVRVSGVPIGRVEATRLARDGAVVATLEIDPRYAPLRSDVRAVLRQKKKKLLGETYVELSARGPTARAFPFNTSDGPVLAR